MIGPDWRVDAGRRPPISGLPEIGSLSAQVGQGRLAMARPAVRAGRAPQGDGDVGVLVAASPFGNLQRKRSKRVPSVAQILLSSGTLERRGATPCPARLSAPPP